MCGLDHTFVILASCDIALHLAARSTLATFHACVSVYSYSKSTMNELCMFSMAADGASSYSKTERWAIGQTERYHHIVMQSRSRMAIKYSARGLMIWCDVQHKRRHLYRQAYNSLGSDRWHAFSRVTRGCRCRK